MIEFLNDLTPVEFVATAVFIGGCAYFGWHLARVLFAVFVVAVLAILALLLCLASGAMNVVGFLALVGAGAWYDMKEKLHNRE